MGDKPYNVSLFKAANKIIRQNRQRERNAAQAQQQAAVIGQIGNAVTGIVGAYGERKQAETLGAQFGLDPQTAAAIGPRELAKARMQMMIGQQVSPYDQARIGTENAQADYYKAMAEYNRGRLGADGGPDPEMQTLTQDLVPFAGGMSTVHRSAVPDVLRAYNASRQTAEGPKTEAQIEEQFRQEIQSDESLARGWNRYQRLIQGDPSVPANDPLVARIQARLPPSVGAKYSAEMNKTMTRRNVADQAAGIQREKMTLDREIAAMRQRGESEDRVAAAIARRDDLAARLSGIALSNAATLGYVDAYGNPDTKRIEGMATGSAGRMIPTQPTGMPNTPGPKMELAPQRQTITRQQAQQSYLADQGEASGYTLDEYMALLAERGFDVTDG